MPVSQSVVNQRAARHQHKLNVAATVIPQGPYCYSSQTITRSENGQPVQRVTPCPYFKNRNDWPDQASGYCRMLKVGDNSNGLDREGRPRRTLHLWDLVKECGVNDP